VEPHDARQVTASGNDVGKLRRLTNLRLALVTGLLPA
jgi:hypothetical protein